MIMTVSEENMIEEKSPRVGDEYQIEIPSLISRSKYISENKNKFNTKIVDSDSTSDDSSSKIERESLLLSLCIFQKDFTQIKKFLGCDVISFYYKNKYYKSDEYRKWLDCKKTKKGKIFLGKWIFNGFRLELLLTRLSTHMSEDGEKSISQVSKLFKDRNITLLEFVTTLKDIAGMKNLIEAVAIGKGKKDLTRMKRGTRKNKLDLSNGITCYSSLTPAQILDFLNGSDIHKRKDGPNNSLFWEAVWPLLLAGGWHLEQPRSCYTKTQSHVFLVPGVAKFSRVGGLVKGMHYFDSISEVLNKVSSDPSLLKAAAREEPQTERENHDSMSNGKTFSTRDVRLFSGESESSQTDSSVEEVSNNINSSHTDSENGMVNEEPKETDWSSSEPTKKRQKKILEEPRPLFDLNYPPPLPAGFDPYDFFVTNEEGGLDYNEPKKSSNEEEEATVASAIENGGSSNEEEQTTVASAIENGGSSNEEEQTTVASAIENGGGPRKSSRKSPPTAKVLEALANGSLITAGRSRTKS